MAIYLPRQIIELQPTVRNPLFFLAGPVRGSGDWQASMAEHIFKREQNAHVAIPCRWDSAHRLASDFHQPFSRADNRQLVWERYYMKQAGLERGVPGCVIFWLGLESVTDPHPGPEPYAMDTRREIGKFTAYAEMMDVRIAVGGSRDFHGLNVILNELDAARGSSVLFFEKMEEIVDYAFFAARGY